HREHALGAELPDHVVVQDLADLCRGRHTGIGFQRGGLVRLADDVHAQLDTFIADEDGRARDELAHLVLRLAAERTVERVLRGFAAGIVLGHPVTPGSFGSQTTLARTLTYDT